MENPVSAEEAADVAASEAAARSPEGPRWRFLISPRWIGWHLLMVGSVVGMLWLGDWQLHRALAGNGLSWAYTFEWPIFSVMVIVFWVKTIRDEFHILARGEQEPSEEPDLPLGIGARLPQATVGADGDGEADDAELAAYNAYLARLNEEVKGHGRWHGLR
jgi:hypothetical protein